LSRCVQVTPLTKAVAALAAAPGEEVALLVGPATNTIAALLEAGADARSR
jgi:hypothetical protein